MTVTRRARNAIILGVLGALLIAVPFIVGLSEFYLNVFIMVGIYMILAMSFQFLNQLSLLNFGHPAYMGMGAYTSAVLTIRLGIPFWVALPIAGIVPMLIGGLVGIPTLRVGMVPFFMISLTILSLFPVVMSNYWSDLFGGFNGLAGVRSPTVSLPGLPEATLGHGMGYYYLTLVIVLVTIVFFWNLDRTRFGKVARAIGSQELTVDAVGVDTFKAKMTAMMIACFFAGIAGSLYAHYIGVVSPSDFGMQPLILMQVYAIVGGMGSVFGPVVGATIVGAVSIFLTNMEVWGEFVFGVILIIVLLLSPDGLWGIGQRIAGRLRRVQREVEEAQP